MKLLPVFIGLLVVVTAGRGEEPELAKILKQREALLVEILETVQKQTNGDAAEVLRKATLDLYTFRRDYGANREDRLHWQQEIIALEKKQVSDVEKQITAGTMARLALARAAERVLAAEQKLIEMKATK